MKSSVVFSESASSALALPAGLLPYQQRWVADTSQVRVWEKSRRIGASWTCALESVLFASRQVGGSDTWYSSYNRETTAEFIRDCAFWCQIVNMAVDAMTESDVDPSTGEEVLTFIIRFPTGNKITALSSNPDNLRNRKGRIIIDEAAFRSLKAAIKAAMAILMWGGRVDILSTHNGVDSEFNAIVEDVRAKKLGYSLHRTTINDAVREGLYKRICLVTNRGWSHHDERKWLDDLVRDYGDDADEELHCVPKRSTGAYLSRLIVEDRMIDSAPVLRFVAPEGFASRKDDQRRKYMLDWLARFVAPALEKLPKDRQHFVGEDFGRTVDITVIAPCYMTQRLRRRIPFLLELRDTPFLEQELAFTFVVDRLPLFGYGALDAMGNGQYLAERAWQRYGEHQIEQVHLSRTWYAENLPPLKAAFEDDDIEIPRDADVLNDLLALRRIKGVPMLPDVRQQSVTAPASRGKKLARHGDAAIAIALAYYATRQPTVEHEGYVSATKRTPAPTKGAGWTGFRSRNGGVL